MEPFSNFRSVIHFLEHHISENAYQIKTEKWQGLDLSDKPQFLMREVLNTSFSWGIPDNIGELTEAVKPNLPWAEDHFKERVGGEPVNPGETYKIWPFYKMDDKMRTEEEKFSHTYMERFWPKNAGLGKDLPNGNLGIRYQYGDLLKLALLMSNEPLTRQAYLPIWFPEDTGAVHGGRVPCTLGYQFIMRDDKLHMVYYIRSCDFVRHFRDDVYLACRLNQWLLNLLRKLSSHKEPWSYVKPGDLTMHICSLHLFQSDYQHLVKYL